MCNNAREKKKKRIEIRIMQHQASKEEKITRVLLGNEKKIIVIKRERRKSNVMEKHLGFSTQFLTFFLEGSEINGLFFLYVSVCRLKAILN